MPLAKKAVSQEHTLREEIAGRLRKLYYARQNALGRAIELQEVGKCVGVTGAAVGKWHSGKGVPTLENLVALAAFYGVPAGWLAFGEEPSGPSLTSVETALPFHQPDAAPRRREGTG